MERALDVVVIGSGVAASSVAQRCREAGWSVAVIDELPLGGTCMLRGCDPKKVLIGVADSVDQALRLRSKGVAGEAPRIDWPALMAFKRTFTDPVPAQRAAEFAARGIAVYAGHARFRGPQTLEVAGELLRGRFIVLANGAMPRPLTIPGAEHLATSTDFLSLPGLPPRLVLLGGGYIAAEFSHLAARAGSKVTILQRSQGLLTQFDPDLVGWLTDKSRALGISIHCGAQVSAIERDSGAGWRVRFSCEGTEQSVTTDLVVHAAGRVPDLQALDLPSGGVATNGEHLQLNEFLQSASNPAVYAAGDAAACGPGLTPVASYDADIVAANLLEGNHARPDYAFVPSVVFTTPALARVGLTEQQARERGLRCRVKCERTASWYTSRRVAEDCAGYKMLIEQDSERIVGAHLLGPGAEETINLFALAMRSGLTAGQFKQAIYTYPTASSDLHYML